MNILSPIVLFVYNRLDHTQQTIESLQKNKSSEKSELYIYSDAPKNEKATDSVSAVRCYLKTIKGFKKITIIERKKNLGLTDSIKGGINQIFKKYDRVIVLEDDIVTSEYFLEFMNEALEKYKNNERVMEISGYNYPIEFGNLKQTYFVRMAACWGWATWARSWAKFSDNIEEIENKIILEDRKTFKVSENYHYWDQLIENKKGNLKTWFIFWYASIFMNNGLVLYPRHSLVQNIGLDGSGQNSRQNNNYNSPYFSEKITFFEEEIEFNKVAHKAYQFFFIKIAPSKFKKMLSKIKKTIFR